MVLIYSFLIGYIRKPCSLNISRISFRSSSFRPGRSPISQSIPSRLYLSAPVRWKGSRFTSFKTGIVCKKRIVSCTLFLSSLKPGITGIRTITPAPCPAIFQMFTRLPESFTDVRFELSRIGSFYVVKKQIRIPAYFF